MHKEATHTAEPVPTREATERIVKNLDRKFFKGDLKLIAANATFKNSDERTKLLGILK